MYLFRGGSRISQGRVSNPFKGAPEVERRRRRGGGSAEGAVPALQSFLHFITMCFYAFPVIFIDNVAFKKGTLIKRAGVRTRWTLPWIHPAISEIK